MAMEEISVPVIDMAKFEAEKEKLRAAVVGLGCFRVINHGITKKIIADMKASARNILELPSEVKHRNIDVIPGSGYVYPNRLSTLFEGLGIYDAKSTADIQAFCSCLGISSHDTEILSTYASALHGFTVDLASKIAECLGIVGCSFQEWSCHLRMNRYNFTKETIGHKGTHVHTDNSFITIILEDESNEGFEMMSSNGNFMAVKHVPETFLISVGDIGKVWSNGRLHSLKHKVVCKKSEPRFTIVFFILAPEDNKIEPLAEFIDYENPRLYRSFDYKEYRKIRSSSLITAGDGVEAIVHWAIDEAKSMA